MDCLNTNFHGPIPKDQVQSQVNSDVDKDILVEPAIDNGIFFELVIEIVPYDPDVRRNDEQRGYVWNVAIDKPDHKIVANSENHVD